MKISKHFVAVIIACSLTACSSGDPVDNAINDIEYFVKTWEQRFKERKPDAVDLEKFQKEYLAIQAKYVSLKPDMKELTNDQIKKLEDIQSRLMNLSMEIDGNDFLDKAMDF